MPLIRPISDVHLEFDPFFVLPELKNDKDTILIIAGDLGIGLNSLNFLEGVSKRFLHVLFVFGNHDYYNQNINLLYDKYESELKFRKINNVTISASGETINIGGVKIVSGTLWTSMNKGNPITMLNIGQMLTDFRAIFKSSNKENELFNIFTPFDAYKLHCETLKYFKENVDENTIVVTHHGPSLKCVCPKFRYSKFNDGFVSDLDDFILEHSPKMWIFGHTHNGTAFKIGRTGILNNSKGYPNEANEKFNPNLVIEV